MSTLAWSDRSVEQARLLNPAFLAALAWSCSEGYRNVTTLGIPYPLLFVAMPVVLHKATRENLPRAVTTSLAAWLVQNPQSHVLFAERATALVSLVKEGILFGANGQLIEVSSSRIIALAQPSSMKIFLAQASEEVNDCMKKAKFVGKWFASSGEYTTIMALWGVAP
jgi:hypothetical protein